MDRIQAAVEAKGPKEEGEAERLRKELEEAKRVLESTKRRQEAEEAKPRPDSDKQRDEAESLRKELQAARRALESARQSQEPKEAEQRRESHETPQPSAVPKVEGGFVYSGEYPQFRVKDASLLNRLKSATPKDGIISLDGRRYAVRKQQYFLFEPIKWRILERKGGEALLVSDSLLDAHRYNKDYYGIKDRHFANNYARSEIREWLDNDFYKTAFALGDDRALATKVDNSAATTDSPIKNDFACENTLDKVFLLSYQDYQDKAYGFTDNASRECTLTDYAAARGASKDSGNSNGWYWTRSPYSHDSHTALGVRIDGDLSGYFVHASASGVRPSLRIKLAE